MDPLKYAVVERERRWLLADAEWERLVGLPGTALAKRRTRVVLGDVVVAVDELRGGLSGLVLAEVDRGGGVLPSADRPVRGEVTSDEPYTGAALALADQVPLSEARNPASRRSPGGWQISAT